MITSISRTEDPNTVSVMPEFSYVFTNGGVNYCTACHYGVTTASHQTAHGSECDRGGVQRQ